MCVLGCWPFGYMWYIGWVSGQERERILASLSTLHEYQLHILFILVS
jgi:hypothetical protein